MIASSGSSQEKSCSGSGVCSSRQGAMLSRKRVNGGIFFVKMFWLTMSLFGLHCQRNYCSSALFCCVIKADAVFSLLATFDIFALVKRVFHDCFMVFFVSGGEKYVCRPRLFPPPHSLCFLRRVETLSQWLLMVLSASCASFVTVKPICL